MVFSSATGIVCPVPRTFLSLSLEFHGVIVCFQAKGILSVRILYPNLEYVQVELVYGHIRFLLSIGYHGYCLFEWINGTSIRPKGFFLFFQVKLIE